MKHWRVWVVIILASGIGVDLLFFRPGLLVNNQSVVINGIAAPPVPTLNPDRVAN